MLSIVIILSFLLQIQFSQQYQNQMFNFISPPTQKTLILRRILIILALITLGQGIFLMFTYEYKTITYLVSFVLYVVIVCNLSYFGCVLNQFINISLIWFLLLEMAIKLKIGLYEIYLSSQGIYKMSSLIFGIISLYFNFIAYKQFKQIAYEIYNEENMSGDFQQRPPHQREIRERERDRYQNYD